MSNIQKTLDSLQPYVIGIRYLEGIPIIDVVFKEGWSIIDDPKISKIKGNDEMNYYMVSSEIAGVTLDDLLSYIDKIIKLNKDREKKYDLLKEKVNELKEVFKKNSLSKLKMLKFSFSEEEIIPSIDELDNDIDVGPMIQDESVSEIPEEEEITETPINIPNMPNLPPNIAYVDENGEPIEMTAEERELAEEEARAKRNIKIFEKKKPAPVSNIAKKMELPPKRRAEIPVSASDYDSGCGCGPTEACDKCIDYKGY